MTWPATDKTIREHKTHSLSYNNFFCDSPQQMILCFLSCFPTVIQKLMWTEEQKNVWKQGAAWSFTAWRSLAWALREQKMGRRGAQEMEAEKGHESKKRTLSLGSVSKTSSGSLTLREPWWRLLCSSQRPWSLSSLWSRIRFPAAVSDPHAGGETRGEEPGHQKDGGSP